MNKNMKLKKYKKLFERPVLYKYGYEVNNTTYYFGVYKRGVKTSGAVVISDKDEKLEDIEEALMNLVRLNLSLDNLNNTLNETYYRKFEDVRSNISCIDQLLTQSDMDVTKAIRYKRAKEGFLNIIQGQDEIVKIGKEFLSFKSERDKYNQYLKGDQDILFSFQTQLILIQVEIMIGIQDRSDDFKFVSEDIKRNYKTEINKQQLQYFETASKNKPGKEDTERITEGANVYENTINETKQHMKEYYDQVVKTTTNQIRNQLRYPKGLS
ncbi:hypothetical protein SAMN05421503_2614 [Terribacillus aidingensis]|uniref:Uncharacterized protein n=2 Tax=Terribacillus aidingensis TaxID=586416 RepID=A0A285P2I5_9BACI|nr:hypothetical protein SAMN05421503_2614 [Terribacillus aidingensis]